MNLTCPHCHRGCGLVAFKTRTCTNVGCGKRIPDAEISRQVKTHREERPVVLRFDRASHEAWQSRR